MSHQITMMAFIYMEYQFLEVAIAHILAVMSPGPDFILISRQSMLYGRKASIYTSLGIALGILFHISYCVIGVEIISSHTYLQQVLTIFCSLYLSYLGITSLISSSSPNDSISSNNNQNNNKINNLRAFSNGLFTNILNVKATLFFLSLYAYLGTDLNIAIKVLYGLWMCIITGMWFILLSLFFTNSLFIRVKNRFYLLINKMMGCMLLYIAIKIYLNSIK